MSKKIRSRKLKEGQEYESVKGYRFTIEKYFTQNKILIKFIEPYSCYKYSCTSNIFTGKVANPYHKCASGVGYMGEGMYQPYGDAEVAKLVNMWRAIFKRCYESETNKNYERYTDCTVSEEWHNFQNFAEWYLNHESYGSDYQLDKDLLVDNNKVYSPETCCLIPRILNTLLPTTRKKDSSLPLGVIINKQGKYQAKISKYGKNKNLGTYLTIQEAEYVYKSAKKEYAGDLAEEWKYLVTVEVYESLLSKEF